jgi:inositol phosphorylceramide mannosyltransferase catalytic subunit
MMIKSADEIQGPGAYRMDRVNLSKSDYGSSTAFRAPIPKRIIQTGKTLPKSVKTRAMVASIRLLHPDYEYLFYDDSQVEIFINQEFPQYRQVYDSFRFPIQKFDFFRYLAIYKLGGFYFDLDVMLASSLSGLLDHGCVFTFEGPTTSEYLCEQCHMAWEIGNYGFGASPQHPFINAIIENCVRAQRDHAWAALAIPKRLPLSKTENHVLFTTGPGLVSRTLAENPELAKSVKVLLPDDVNDPETWHCFGDVGVHLMESSWRPKSGRLRQRLKLSFERWKRSNLFKQSDHFGEIRRQDYSD